MRLPRKGLRDRREHLIVAWETLLHSLTSSAYPWQFPAVRLSVSEKLDIDFDRVLPCLHIIGGRPGPLYGAAIDAALSGRPLSISRTR